MFIGKLAEILKVFIRLLIIKKKYTVALSVNFVIMVEKEYLHILGTE